MEVKMLVHADDTGKDKTPNAKLLAKLATTEAALISGMSSFTAAAQTSDISVVALTGNQYQDVSAAAAIKSICESNKTKCTIVAIKPGGGISNSTNISKASTSGKSASKHPAETSKKEDGPQELGRSLDTQAGEGADYGASHSTQQVTFEGAKALAQAQGKTSRAYRRQQRRNRVATKAARDAAGEAPWAVLVGEEWEDRQQQEPTQECDDWGLYCQATDGDGYHPSCNLR
jgi:hypothetical protein